MYQDKQSSSNLLIGIKKYNIPIDTKNKIIIILISVFMIW